MQALPLSYRQHLPWPAWEQQVHQKPALVVLGLGKQWPTHSGLLLPAWEPAVDGTCTTAVSCTGTTCGKAQLVARQQNEHEETWAANALTKRGDLGEFLPCQAAVNECAFSQSSESSLEITQ